MALAVNPDIYCIIYLGNAKFISTWISALLARATGKRVFFWTHGWTRREKGLTRQIRNTFYRCANGLLLYGQRAKRIGVEEGFPQETLHVIYNSLDYDKQRLIRNSISTATIEKTVQAYAVDSDLGYIIYTGRLTPECKLDECIEALSRLDKSGKKVSLLLVGDGEDKTRLEELAGMYGVRVIFYGACYEESKLGRLIMGAKAMVCPGKIGLSAMHSLAYGTPVVTHSDLDSQMPEVESIIPGKNGDLFEKGNTEDLAKTIDYWVTRTSRNPQDCYAIIEEKYNPDRQKEEILKAISLPPKMHARTT